MSPFFLVAPGHAASNFGSLASLQAAMVIVNCAPTVLIDGNGQEIGRKIGPADWDSPEAIEFFEALP